MTALNILVVIIIIIRFCIEPMYSVTMMYMLLSCLHGPPRMEPSTSNVRAELSVYLSVNWNASCHCRWRRTFCRSWVVWLTTEKRVHITL